MTNEANLMDGVYSTLSSQLTTTPLVDHGTVVAAMATHSEVRAYVKNICFYSLGVIIPVGFVCNVFCVCVCALSVGLRRTTTGHYLVALAVADSLFLIGELTRWLNTTSPQETRQVHSHSINLSKQIQHKSGSSQ